jgi:hypothetical protein
MFRDNCYRGAKKLAEVLDSLAFYYNLALAILFIWGVYAAFVREAPNAVSVETSTTAYNVWLTWHLVAPPVIWIGQLIPNQRVQWWLRWAGDAALFALVATYIIALREQIHAQVLGASDFLMFIPCASAVFAICFSTRDLIKALSASKGCDQ